MSNVRISSGLVNQLLADNGVTTTTVGAAKYKDSPFATFQATVVGSGTVGATILIEASNDGIYWCSTPLGTIVLTGTTASSDGFSTDSAWKYIRARVTAISGTSARVYVNIGV